LWDSPANVKFFLKGQQKVDLKEDGWLREEGGVLKPGQGVSALPKVFNHIAAPYVRAFEQVVEQSFIDGAALGYGKSKDEIGKIFTSWPNPDRDFLMLDLTQQDCCKGLWTDLFMDKLFDLYGVPKEISEIAKAQHTNWVMNAIGIDATLHVKDKFQSGDPWTLTANTMMEIGVVGMSYEFGEIYGMMAQGDDFICRAQKYNRTENHFERLKEEVNSVGLFCGMLFVGNLGPLLDLPRCCAKLLNKTFDNNKTLEEYRTAVKDWLTVLYNCDRVLACCGAVSTYYGITVGEAEILLGGLVGFASGSICPSLNVRDDSYIKSDIVTKIL
jgi:hypothetical protein